jgi:hypothetical protein
MSIVIDCPIASLGGVAEQPLGSGISPGDDALSDLLTIASSDDSTRSPQAARGAILEPTLD